ncbi:hypothetical protein MACK_000572 [Theileria orientalis]|uniref:Uncharacterized protein n=1 Tax=Theileria orientalis TaxID=68886 RepID=A0A976MA70_THEOR|nr:hypothetical protein MACK_000572 [Theileria orientalis]
MPIELDLESNLKCLEEACNKNVRHCKKAVSRLRNVTVESKRITNYFGYENILSLVELEHKIGSKNSGIISSSVLKRKLTKSASLNSEATITSRISSIGTNRSVSSNYSYLNGSIEGLTGGHSEKRELSRLLFVFLELFSIEVKNNDDFRRLVNSTLNDLSIIKHVSAELKANLNRKIRGLNSRVKERVNEYQSHLKNVNKYDKILQPSIVKIINSIGSDEDAVSDMNIINYSNVKSEGYGHGKETLVCYCDYDNLLLSKIRTNKELFNFFTNGPTALKSRSKGTSITSHQAKKGRKSVGYDEDYSERVGVTKVSELPYKNSESERKEVTYIRRSTLLMEEEQTNSDSRKGSVYDSAEKTDGSSGMTVLRNDAEKDGTNEEDEEVKEEYKELNLDYVKYKCKLLSQMLLEEYKDYNNYNAYVESLMRFCVVRNEMENEFRECDEEVEDLVNEFKNSQIKIRSYKIINRLTRYYAKKYKYYCSLLKMVTSIKVQSRSSSSYYRHSSNAINSSITSIASINISNSSDGISNTSNSISNTSDSISNSSNSSMSASNTDMNILDHCNNKDSFNADVNDTGTINNNKADDGSIVDDASIDNNINYSIDDINNINNNINNINNNIDDSDTNINGINDTSIVDDTNINNMSTMDSANGDNYISGKKVIRGEDNVNNEYVDELFECYSVQDEMDCNRELVLTKILDMSSKLRKYYKNKYSSISSSKVSSDVNKTVKLNEKVELERNIDLNKRIIDVNRQYEEDRLGINIYVNEYVDYVNKIKKFYTNVQDIIVNMIKENSRNKKFKNSNGSINENYIEISKSGHGVANSNGNRSNSMCNNNINESIGIDNISGNGNTNNTGNSKNTNNNNNNSNNNSSTNNNTNNTNTNNNSNNNNIDKSNTYERTTYVSHSVDDMAVREFDEIYEVVCKYLGEVIEQMVETFESILKVLISLSTHEDNFSKQVDFIVKNNSLRRWMRTYYDDNNGTTALSIVKNEYIMCVIYGLSMIYRTGKGTINDYKHVLILSNRYVYTHRHCGYKVKGVRKETKKIEASVDNKTSTTASGSSISNSNYNSNNSNANFGSSNTNSSSSNPINDYTSGCISSCIDGDSNSQGGMLVNDGVESIQNGYVATDSNVTIGTDTGNTANTPGSVTDNTTSSTTGNIIGSANANTTSFATINATTANATSATTSTSKKSTDGGLSKGESQLVAVVGVVDGRWVENDLKLSINNYVDYKLKLTGEVLFRVRCSLIDKIYLNGTMMVTSNEIGFHSYFNKTTLLGKQTYVTIRKKDIVNIVVNNSRISTSAVEESGDESSNSISVNNSNKNKCNDKIVKKKSNRKVENVNKDMMGNNKLVIETTQSKYSFHVMQSLEALLSNIIVNVEIEINDRDIEPISELEINMDENTLLSDNNYSLTLNEFFEMVLSSNTNGKALISKSRKQLGAYDLKPSNQGVKMYQYPFNVSIELDTSVTSDMRRSSLSVSSNDDIASGIFIINSTGNSGGNNGSVNGNIGTNNSRDSIVTRNSRDSIGINNSGSGSIPSNFGNNSAHSSSSKSTRFRRLDKTSSYVKPLMDGTSSISSSASEGSDGSSSRTSKRNKKEVLGVMLRKKLEYSVNNNTMFNTRISTTENLSYYFTKDKIVYQSLTNVKDMPYSKHFYTVFTIIVSNTTSEDNNSNLSTTNKTGSTCNNDSNTNSGAISDGNSMSHSRTGTTVAYSTGITTSSSKLTRSAISSSSNTGSTYSTVMRMGRSNTFSKENKINVKIYGNVVFTKKIMFERVIRSEAMQKINQATNIVLDAMKQDLLNNNIKKESVRYSTHKFMIALFFVIIIIFKLFF